MPTDPTLATHVSEARAAIDAEDWPRAREVLLAGAQTAPLSEDLHALMAEAFPSLPAAVGQPLPEWLAGPEAIWAALHREPYPRESLLDLLPELGRVDEALFPEPELPAWPWMRGPVERDSGTAIDCDRGLARWIPFDAPGHDGRLIRSGPVVRLEGGVLGVLQTTAADDRREGGDEVWFFTAYRIRGPLLHGHWLRLRPAFVGAMPSVPVCEPDLPPEADPVDEPTVEEAGREGGRIHFTFEGRGRVRFTARTPGAREAVAALLKDTPGIVKSQPFVDKAQIEVELVSRGLPHEQARAIAESAEICDDSYFVVRR